MPEDIATFEDVIAIAESKAALQCVIEGKDIWIPKAVITDDSEVYTEGDRGELVIKEWFAVKGGLV